MQHTLRSRDFVLLAYGVVCAAALFYYVSESVFGAVVFSPMGAVPSKRDAGRYGRQWRDDRMTSRTSSELTLLT